MPLPRRISHPPATRRATAFGPNPAADSCAVVIMPCCPAATAAAAASSRGPGISRFDVVALSGELRRVERRVAPLREARWANVRPLGAADDECDAPGEEDEAEPAGGRQAVHHLHATAAHSTTTLSPTQRRCRSPARLPREHADQRVVLRDG